MMFPASIGQKLSVKKEVKVVLSPDCELPLRMTREQDEPLPNPGMRNAFKT
jgi:hypothetical protein